MFEPSREKLGRLGITSITLPNPTRTDVLRQLDLLRAGLRIAVTTIRKMKHNQKVDADAVLRRLAVIRAEAKEVRDSARSPRTV